MDDARRQRSFGRGRSSHAGSPAPPPPCRAQVQSGARLGASHRRPMRRPCRSFRPRAGQADAIPGRTFALATGSQFARRVFSGDGRDGGANRRPRRGAYRRCHDLGGDRQRRFARFCAAAPSASMSWFSRGRYKILFQAALVLRSAATLKLASVFALTSSSVTPSASSIRVMPPLLPLSMEKTAKSVITRSTTAVPVSGKVQ